MKVHLKFDLKDKEEELLLKRTLSATNLYLAVHDFETKLRRDYIKHGRGISAGDILNLEGEARVKLIEDDAAILQAFCEQIAQDLQQSLDDYEINMNNLE